MSGIPPPPPPPPPPYENSGGNRSTNVATHDSAQPMHASLDVAQTPPQPHNSLAGGAPGGSANQQHVPLHPTSAPTPYSGNVTTTMPPSLPPGARGNASHSSSTAGRAHAYASSRMASSSFGDFHVGHLNGGGGAGGGGGNSSMYYSGNSATTAEAAPMSSVGIPSQQRSLSTDDADIAAGLYVGGGNVGGRGRHQHAVAPSSSSLPISSSSNLLISWNRCRTESLSVHIPNS